MNEGLRRWLKLGGGFVAIWIASWYQLYQVYADAGRAAPVAMLVVVSLSPALLWAVGMLDRTFAAEVKAAMAGGSLSGESVAVNNSDRDLFSVNRPR